MPIETLQVESEPYSRYGNMSADGIKKLLGAPHLDQLQTVIREAVQNSWDAGKGIPGPVSFSAGLRILASEHHAALKEKIFGELPRDANHGSHPLAEALAAKTLSVIELSDFGTSGLGGPTRPDEVPDGEECPDFVDFMRNVGTPRDTEHGGGTYGYGKSSLYAFSGCQTIVVYTHAEYEGEPIHRLMACRIGSRFDIAEGTAAGRYTGRHWWGHDSDGVVDPVTGEQAIKLAKDLGMPARDTGEFGTTIMILEPLLGEMTIREAGRRVSEIFLWHFWPKMIPESDSGDSPPMNFQVLVSGDELDFPKPDDCPPLNLYADALRKIRSEDDDTEVIRCKKPKAKLGRLCIEKGLQRQRASPYDNEDCLIPDVSRYVALMRPAELVITYLEGEALGPGVEWGGVFVCSEEHSIEQAFAAAEPPAHDDWDPEFLPAGSWEKTWVKVALRNIRNEMSEVPGEKTSQPLGEDEDISLGEFADSMGQLIDRGQRLGKPDSPKGPSPGNPITVSPPSFTEFEDHEGKTCAVFNMRVKVINPMTVNINGAGKIIKDGGGSDAYDASGHSASVLAWRTSDGEVIEGSFFPAEIETSLDVDALVSIPGEKVVSVKVTAERADA